MATLYRTYRPQNFKEIVNQNHIKITLAHEIETGKMAHAYLFCGPRGIGKTTVARILAKAINCESRKEGEHEPCGQCEMCLDVTAGRSLDIIEIDAASHTGVDNVRENVISVARVAPTRAKFKVFIIDEVHMLSISAFNALLKLLEEPPLNTVFILCTTEAHKIPDTIISRTERFDFKRIGAKDIVKKLQYIISKEGIKMDNVILENIARHSGGHMRDAESLLGQVVAIGGKEVSLAEADLVIPRSDLGEVISLIDSLAKKDAATAIGLLNGAVDDGINLKRFAKETLEILRKMMLLKVNQGLGERLGLEMGESMELRITEICKSMEMPQIIRAIERLLLAQSGMSASFIEQLPLELAIIELCLPEKTYQPKQAAAANQIRKEQGPSGTPASNASLPASNDEPQAVANNPANAIQGQGSGSMNQDEIFDRWNEVLARVKSHNHSLSFILRACKPTGINGNQLCLAFKYKFHKDRINEVNIKQVVEKVLHEVYGQAITIEAVVDEELRIDNGQEVAGQQPAQEMPPAGEAPAAKEAQTAPQNGQTNGSDEDMLNNVLKAFGGKVV